MADDLTLDQVHHILGDVGRMIGNALQVPGRGKERQSRLHHLGILLHQGDQFLDDIMITLIDFIVESANAAGQSELGAVSLTVQR